VDGRTIRRFSTQIRDESDRYFGRLYIFKDITVRQQAETILQQTKEKLEILVAERTAALSQANKRLQRELEERRQAEANLRELERRWRTLLENVPLVVVGLDRNGQVEYVNPFFLELTGYVQGEVLSKDWFNTFVPKSQRQQAFEEILTQQFRPHYQYSILTKSGAEKIIVWNSTRLRNWQGEVSGTMSIGLDITERYAIEQMKDEFISVVSHELRTPLTSIHAALKLLASGLVPPNSEDGKRITKIATENSEHLVLLVDDILELERLESGKINLDKQPVNSLDLMHRAVAQVQVIANQAGITLEIAEPDITLYADGECLLQVLVNLLSNAIKFSQAGSTVWLTVQWLGSEVKFTVKDTGQGIPTDKLESIFERFHQVDATDSRQKGGTGLGLAICRSIVEQHGGQIWVESVLGKGSSFYFTLPVHVAEAENDDKSVQDPRL
jgi:PAS domain S-box-containing protein